MERVITVCYNFGQNRKSGTILVRDGSFVRFAILEACNALKVRYNKKFGFFRPSNAKSGHYVWIHPNSRFPLNNQSEEEAFEIKICNNADYQSNMDVIRLTVENLSDPDAKPVMVQMNTSSFCYLIPVMYRKLGRQKIEKANQWNVLINGNELVDSGSRICEYDINDGDKVSICSEIEIEDAEDDANVVWI